MLKVEKILKKKDISYRLIPLKEKSISAKDIIKHGNVNEEEICKTIIVKDKKRNFYGCFLKGKDIIDKDKVKKIVGIKTRIATHDNVREIAKVNPGEVCPLLLNVPIMIDSKVLDLKKINFGSGNLMFGIEMKLKDFLGVLKSYMVEDFSL